MIFVETSQFCEHLFSNKQLFHNNALKTDALNKFVFFFYVARNIPESSYLLQQRCLKHKLFFLLARNIPESSHLLQHIDTLIKQKRFFSFLSNYVLNTTSTIWGKITSHLTFKTKRISIRYLLSVVLPRIYDEKKDERLIIRETFLFFVCWRPAKFILRNHLNYTHIYKARLVLTKKP